MGPHGFGVMNNTRLTLIEYCAANGLVISETLFHHKTNHKYTWVSSDGTFHKQIDHVMVKGKWRKALLDVCTNRGADIRSDLISL